MKQLSDKHKFLDKALFIDGFRQTRWTAFVGGLICVFLILFQIQGSFALRDYFFNNPAFMDISAYQMGISNMVEYLDQELVYVFMNVIMMFQLFRFLNKRNANDFYGMLPQKPLKVYMTYCAVVLMWTILIVVGVKFISEVSSLLLGVNRVESDGVLSATVSLLRGMGVGLFYILPKVIMAMGAVALALATTGTAFSGFFVFLILWIAPTYIMSLYQSGFEQLIPFVVKDYSKVNYLTHDLAFNLILGLGGIVLSGALYCRRKGEMAGTLSISRLWKMIFRLLLTLVIAIYADMTVAEIFIHKIPTEDISSNIVWRYVCVLIAWLAFELIVTRKWKLILQSFKQLPLFLVMNLMLVLNFYVVAVNQSQVTDFDKIESIQILEGFDFYNYTTSNPTFNRTEYIFTDEKVIEELYHRWSYEMKEYHNSRTVYENYSNNRSGIKIAFQTTNGAVIRMLYPENEEKQKIYDYFVEASKKIYDPDILPEPDAISEVWDCTSFGWDFNQEQFEKLYKCYYEEAKELKLPLSTYLGRDYHRSGVFDFMKLQQLDLPISIHMPKTVATLASIGNEMRTDYDFDWFVNYIHSIGTNEMGATLEVIMYVDGEEEIRYDSFGWWSDWSWDISNEQLAQLQQIATNHKNDEGVSGEENILILVYKNINNVNVTGRWYNITDEEVAVLQSMMSKNGVFQRYSYFKY